jgi:hypothetical protein
MYNFTHTVPLNKKKLKRAIISMLVVIAVCAIGVVLSELYWDEYTREVYSVSRGRNVTKGWPANVYSWGLFIGCGFTLLLPVLYFMQDWKNPSLGILHEGLFINQQMIKNVIVPFSNISSIEKKETGYHIHFKENEPVYTNAGIFKAFVKHNLKEGGFSINEETSPELDLFFNELNKRISQASA